MEGITGSGKTTVIRGILDWLRNAEQKIFSLESWCVDNHAWPITADFKHADVLATMEPSYAWLGAAIRGELSRTDRPYTSQNRAEAFALERLMLYRRLVLPAREMGMTVVQDRGVGSSLAYQTVADDAVTDAFLLSLSGNQLALAHTPDTLIITECPVETAIARLKNRLESSHSPNRGVFLDPNLLIRVTERFRSQAWQNYFTSRGTDLIFLDTSAPLEDVQKNVVALCQKLFPSLLSPL